MIRSIHVLGSHQLGGAERFFLRLTAALAESGHPTLAVLRPDSPALPLLSPQVERLTLPMASQWDLLSAWRLRRIVAARRPDIVQSYMGRATRLTRVPRASGAVHVARLGGYYRIDGAFRHADAWVGNTPDIGAYLCSEGLPAARVFCIGNFVPPPRAVGDDELAGWRRRLALPADAFVVVALGRMLPKKGFQDLLPAFAQQPDELAGRPLRLVLGGDGPARETLQAQARALGLGRRIVWAGWLEDPAPLYALADLFVCPSREEPLGNVILEAWGHRRPVLSTRTLGARQLAVDGRDAVLVPPRDVQALARAMLALSSAPAAERQRLAEAGHATLQRAHAPQAVLDAYLALYRQLGTARAADRGGGRRAFSARS